MSRKVLIVDDEKKIRDLVAFRLEFKGYQVQNASNGTEAIQSVEKDPPELIVLDIMMPDITGYEVCKRLKSDEKTKKIKIILLTAKGRKQDEEEGFSVGADAYMTKPFRANILLDKIEELLNG
ncbi:MAG: response regulator [Deltaproteobacteria bacterium]|nr:response regulator [Deltaproteobacteria bacterium]